MTDISSRHDQAAQVASHVSSHLEDWYPDQDHPQQIVGHGQARLTFALDITRQRLTISGVIPSLYIRHRLGPVPPLRITAAATTQPSELAHRIRTRLLPLYDIALARVTRAVTAWTARRTAAAVVSHTIAERLPGARLREHGTTRIAVSVMPDGDRPGVTVEVTPTELHIHVTGTTAHLDLVTNIVDAVATARDAT